MSVVSKKKTKSITFRLPEEDYKALKKFAQERERTISFVLGKFTKSLLAKSQNIKTKKSPTPIEEIDFKNISDEDWNYRLKQAQEIGREAFASWGMDVDKMTEEDAYNFFKSI